MLSALQAGAQGTQACINAVSSIEGIIGDLETTIMFANAATLNPDRKPFHVNTVVLMSILSFSIKVKVIHLLTIVRIFFVRPRHSWKTQRV